MAVNKVAAAEGILWELLSGLLGSLKRSVRAELLASLIEKSDECPIHIPRTHVLFSRMSRYLKRRDSEGWLFKRYLYEVRGAFSENESRLLILEHFDKERRKFERLRQLLDSEEMEEATRARPRITEAVRIAVWRRDGGKCVRCGSRENLEYDHIVPVSKGGSNTVRNVELLCQRCNREKSDKIG